MIVEPAASQIVPPGVLKLQSPKNRNCGQSGYGQNSKKGSAEVTQNSDAMDLEPNVFENNHPKKIALSLKQSAEHSDRKKAGSFQSAMTMLNFYINRAGRNLPKRQKQVLERAKDKLREAFGRKPT